MSRLNCLLHVKCLIYYIYTGDNEQLQSIATSSELYVQAVKNNMNNMPHKFNVLFLLNSFILLQQETRWVYKMLFAEKENFEGWQIEDG